MTAGRISANIHLIRICLVFFSVQLYISYRSSCIYSLCRKRRNPGMTILNCTYTIQGYVSSLSLVFLVCGVIICKCSVVPSICAYSTFECFFNASIGIFFICACSLYVSENGSINSAFPITCMLFRLPNPSYLS